MGEFLADSYRLVELLHKDFEEPIQLEVWEACLRVAQYHEVDCISTRLTMDTGPAVVFFLATLRLSNGPYLSAWSR